MSHRQLQTLADATDAIRAFVPTTSMIKNYKLDRMKALMAALGNPQEQLKVIHVAGTSGKTSTAYFIRDLLEQTGQRVGLTISPHITAVNERLQVDGGPLSEPQFVHAVGLFLAILKKTDIRPTYYELLMALAYWYCAHEQLDYIVVETGLGGMLDGSNVVMRPDKVCVISDIGLEHTEVLGNTLAAIAGQKAGIVQSGNHLITHAQSPEIMQAFQSRLQMVGATIEIAPLCTVSDAVSFQRRNVSLAAAAYSHIAARDGLPPITELMIKHALTCVPPGRMELCMLDGKTIILDGAHNPQKITALYDELQQRGWAPLPVLAGFVQISEHVLAQRIGPLAPLCSQLLITNFEDQQDFYKHSLPADAIAAAAARAGVADIQTFQNPVKALEALLACPGEKVLITGSLYLIRQLRPLIEQHVGHSERSKR